MPLGSLRDRAEIQGLKTRVDYIALTSRFEQETETRITFEQR